MLMKEKLVPDYEQKCDNCGASPVVTIENENNEVIYNYEMCGPCVFGEADCIDPENWGMVINHDL